MGYLRGGSDGGSPGLSLGAVRFARKLVHLTNGRVRALSTGLQHVEDRATRYVVQRGEGANGIPLDAYLGSSQPRLRPLALAWETTTPAVNVFVSLDSDGFFGGVATQITVAAALAAEVGARLRIVQTTAASTDLDMAGFLDHQGVPLPAHRIEWANIADRGTARARPLAVNPDDVFLVSAWWDAHLLSHSLLPTPFVYLVQDYEPIFYNNSDSQLLADATYRTNDFIAMLNTSVLREFFEARGYGQVASGVSFEPAVGIAPRAVTKAPDGYRLFLYGRPQVDRNLFNTALRALDLAFQDSSLSGQPWQIVTAGSKDVPPITLTSGHVVEPLGKMSLTEYHEFVASCDVAVSPMLAPHPNYPTLEFASLGAQVVTTAWETKTDLSRYASSIRVVEPSPEALARGIVDAAGAVATGRPCLPVVSPPTVASSIGSSWSAALCQPVSEVAKRLGKAKQ